MCQDMETAMADVASFNAKMSELEKELADQAAQLDTIRRKLNQYMISCKSICA